MINIFLISEFGHLLADIPRAFNSPDISIKMIGGSQSVFKGNDGFIEIQGFGKGSFIQSFLDNSELLLGIKGLVIIGTDLEMREIAEADIVLEVKQRLLPIKNPEAFKILDSKVGLQEVMNDLRLTTPDGLVIQERSDLEGVESKMDRPYLIKGDNGGGGMFVRGVATNSPFPNIDDLNYPFLLQKEITGSEVFVDGFFINGLLKSFVYADEIKSIYKYGPSYLRRISAAPSNDFILTLECIGRFTGANGFINATFIFDILQDKHFLIEFDPRPNAWHFLAPTLGIDLVSIITDPVEQKIASPLTVGFRIILVNRFMRHLFEIQNPWLYLKAVSNLFDPKLLMIRGERLKKREVLKIILLDSQRVLLFKIMRRMFRILPSKITDPLKRRMLTNKVARKVLGPI